MIWPGSNVAFTLFLYLASILTPSLVGRSSRSRGAATPPLARGDTSAGQPETALSLAPTFAAVPPSLAVKKLCRLPSEAGPCAESIRRFYYSAHSRHCVEFVYGGCNGNENNFDNVTECEDTCQGVLPCPYVAWVPGCILRPNGEDTDGCQTYEMSCEPIPSDNDKTTSTRKPLSTASDASPPTSSTLVKTTANPPISLNFSPKAQQNHTVLLELLRNHNQTTVDSIFANETTSSVQNFL